MNLTTQVGICNLALMRLGKAPNLTSITSGNALVDDVIAASYDPIREDLLAQFPWHFAQKRKELDYTVQTISGITTATPPVVTVADITAFADGSLGEITHQDGMTNLNNTTFFLDGRNTTANTTKLYDEDPASQSDVTGTETLNSHDPIVGAGTWTANGQLRLVPYGYDYAYDLPADCIAVTSLMNERGPSWMPYEINLDKLYTNLEDAFIEYSYQVTDDAAPIFHATFINCFAWRLAAEWAKRLADDIDVAKEMKDQYKLALTAAQTNDARQNPRSYDYIDSFISARG